MFPESKITEIYCMANDFLQEIFVTRRNIYEHKATRHRNKPNRMNDAEIKVSA